MYRVIELTLKKDMMTLFQFLKDNPTQTYQQGDYFKLLYFEPLGAYLTPFSIKGIRVNLTDKPNTDSPWQLVRDLPRAWAGLDLMAILNDLEKHSLEKQRTGTGLDLSGWVLERIKYGISTEEDTVKLIKVMFLHGYDLEDVIGVFSSIVRREGLSRHFLTTAQSLYKGVA